MFASRRERGTFGGPATGLFFVPERERVEVRLRCDAVVAQSPVGFNDGDFEDSCNGNGDKHSGDAHQLIADQQNEDDRQRMHIDCLGETERLYDNVVDRLNGDREYDDRNKHAEIAELRQGDEEGRYGSDDRPEIRNEVRDSRDRSDEDRVVDPDEPQTCNAQNADDDGIENPTAQVAYEVTFDLVQDVQRHLEIFVGDTLDQVLESGISFGEDEIGDKGDDRENRYQGKNIF